MRLGLVVVALMLSLTLSRTARADSRADATWATPVVRVTLLEGWHERPQQSSMLPSHSASRDSADESAKKNADPGSMLTEAVERMWSQVRAYRRPGGAEFVVRGRF